MSKKYKIAGLFLALLLCFIFAYEKQGSVSSNNVKYVGHRGIAGLASENTLVSFNLAGKLGYWGTECDVRTTSDGNWVILHDSTVDRTTNGTGPLEALSLSQVQSLKIKTEDNVIDYPGERIPTLQDYLAVCKKWGMVSVIEMKSGDEFQYYDKFFEIVRKYGDMKKTILTSVSIKVLNEFRTRDADVTLGYICRIINDSDIDTVKKLGNAYIECAYPNVTKSSVDLCHKNNIKIGAWTVDDKAIADKLIKIGVDIITTNRIGPPN